MPPSSAALRIPCRRAYPCLPTRAPQGWYTVRPAAFPRPDASRGWYSGLEKYYFGYTLFQLSCYNSELRTDIPLLLRFTSARRHDPVNFPAAFHELEKHMPAVSASNMCLDSAMDNYPACRILKNSGIRAFIDLNDKCSRPKTIPDTITIDKDGTPLCQEKPRMKPNGYDRSSGYLMWRCPYGKEHCSKCKNSCTDSKNGRVVKTRPEWDIRLYTDVPRGTDAYLLLSFRDRSNTWELHSQTLVDSCCQLPKMRLTGNPNLLSMPTFMCYTFRNVTCLNFRCRKPDEMKMD